MRLKELRGVIAMSHKEKSSRILFEEQKLFKTFCPKMVESAAEIVNEMITEGIC